MDARQGLSAALEKGENKEKFLNHRKHMKAPYVIYADIEANIRKIHTCMRGPKVSFTEKNRETRGMLFYFHSCEKRWCKHTADRLQGRKSGLESFYKSSAGGEKS